MTVVEKRSYSRNSGTTWWEAVGAISGAARLTASSARRSWSGFA